MSGLNRIQVRDTHLAEGVIAALADSGNHR
jgi:hypothetical protein